MSVSTSTESSPFVEKVEGDERVLPDTLNEHGGDTEDGDEMWTDCLCPARETAQPAPHGREMAVQITGRPAMSLAGGLGHQGGTDHLNAIPAPLQAVLGQQHVGRPTSSAARSARTTALFGPTAPHDAHSALTPRT
jgi:hypothetical protein